MGGQGRGSKNVERNLRQAILDAECVIAKSQRGIERRRLTRSGEPAMSSRFTFGISITKRRQLTAPFCCAR